MDKVWWKQARLAAAEMKKKVKKGILSKGQVTLFAYAHDKTVDVSHTQYCHAGLSGVPKGCIAIVNSIQEGHRAWVLSVEEKEMFLHWLANDSAFAPVFVSKSAKQMLKQGHAFLRTDVPGALLGGACVAMRFLWENAHRTLVWVDLSKGGMDKSLAFYLCHFIHVGSRESSAQLANWADNHVVFDNISTGSVKNFITGNITGSKETYQETSRYRGYGSHLFTGNGPYLINLTLGLYKPVAEKKKKNPFKKEEDNGVAYQDCINELLRLKDKLMEEVMNA